MYEQILIAAAISLLILVLSYFLWYIFFARNDLILLTRSQLEDHIGWVELTKLILQADERAAKAAALESESESESEDDTELGDLPDERACLVGITPTGVIIDKYLTTLTDAESASIAKFINNRTRLIKELQNNMSPKDALFASQLLYYAIADISTPLPDCSRRMKDLIVRYFREACHAPKSA